MIECPSCAESLPDGSDACTHCGERLTGPAPRPAAPPARSGGIPGWAIALIVLAVCGVCAVPVLGIVAALLLPAVSNVNESANQSRCKANLKQIGLAITLEQDRNADRAISFDTPLFERLHAEILPDSGVYICPSSGNAVAPGVLVCDYRAWSGGSLAEADIARGGSRIPIAWDANYHALRICLFADGHVEALEDAAFEAALGRAATDHHLKR